MTNFVVGNGIHLPSLVVSTVGVVSESCFLRAATTAEAVVEVLQKHQIKSRFAYFKWEVYQHRIPQSITFSKLALSFLQRYFVSIISLPYSIIAVRSSLS